VPRPLAVLDACVLVPAVLSDLLLRVAAEGLYQAYWTPDILEEVRRTLLNDLHLTDTQAARRIEAMAAAFPDALITHHSPLVDAMPNDPKDRHVLAAAVASGAQVIVTLNLRDFPTDVLAPHDVESWSPDMFLGQLFGQHPQDVVSALQKQAVALRNPPGTIDDILTSLTRHAPAFISAGTRIPAR
jgi:predicted nucleic acid-binding protein